MAWIIIRSESITPKTSTECSDIQGLGVYHTDAFKLPMLYGYGQIASTAVAVSLDSGLRGQAHNLLEKLETGDVKGFFAVFENFILDWGGVDEIQPDSRGDHIDARHLAFLEQVYGSAFSEYGSSDPDMASGQELEAKFDVLMERLAARFIAQSAASSVALVSDETTSIEYLQALFESHAPPPSRSSSGSNRLVRNDTATASCAGAFRAHPPGDSGASAHPLMGCCEVI